MLFDLRFALRQISRNRGFAALAVFTLALGIGATTAIFSVINSVLLEPMPYPDPQELVWVFESRPDGGHNSVSGGAFKDWVEHQSRFSDLAVIEKTRRNFTGGGRPERISGWKVSTGFLPVLGITPQLGRGFATGQDTLGGESHVLVLSHELWSSRYGGDEDIVGKVAILDQVPHTIIGVLPPAVMLRDEAEFLIPIVIDDVAENWERWGHRRQVIARLAPGVTLIQAQAELRGIKQRLSADYPTFKEDWSVAVIPLQEPFAAPTRPTLAILLGTASLVLLIACANVSNLLLARGTARSREVAIRRALGAHSWRIVRQWLLESLVLAFVGCGFGLLLATFGIDLLASLVGDALPAALQPELDTRVLLFSIVLSCGCGLLFGILPALSASQPDLTLGLEETVRGTTSRSGRRTQASLIVAQFAFTLVLLVGAGLLLRSFVRLLDVDPGFDPRGTLAFDLSFPEEKYPDAEDRMRFIQQLTKEIEALPAVESVGAVSALPLSDQGRTEFASRSDREESYDYLVGSDFVSGDYFSAMDIRLLRGRALGAADNAAGATPVLVIDQTIERDLFSDQEALGQHLRFIGRTWQIVGIVEPVHHGVLFRDPRPRIYAAQAASPWSTSIVLRTATPPASFAETVRTTILRLDPDQPIANVRTLEQEVHRSLARQRTTLIVLGTFAVVALALACIGIYGVVSYSIGLRTRELGIRSALGAQRQDLVRMIVHGGLRLSLVGIALGSLGAFLLSRLIQSLLFEVEAYDPWVYVGSAALLATVAVGASYLPAQRAAGHDPSLVLRDG